MKKEECSFLKKRTKRLLYLVPADRSGTWPDRWEGRRLKSLLLLFFRKEGLPYTSLIFMIASTTSGSSGT
jgi:hypothetical protein